ncbi:MAG TPA: glutamate-5-semialdehyde dehydrogenase [Polyangiaceae bacterium]|nr:glutamate-5-semialdehyde dehydrogenase [Polyangiaceae bacterium]
MTVRSQCELAKAASRHFARAGTSDKNAGLTAIANTLRRLRAEIESANQVDLAAASAENMAPAMLDRLRLDGPRLESLAQAVEHVRSLPDPVGQRSQMRRLESGLQVGRARVPLGVIGMIYESRPNVTVDAAVLCLKSGNAAVLRGGKEARHTNCALGNAMREALRSAGLPEEAVQIIEPGSREEITELIRLSDLLDLVIPRGGEGLIRFVAEHARVPVIKHYKGVCHLFVDAGADPARALALTLNGKVQRPSVCNALECLLVDQSEAAAQLPGIAAALAAAGVEMRACERALPLMPGAKAAVASDFGAEFLDLVLAVAVMDDLDDALAHIERYGSGHTEAICSDSYSRCQRFLREVDASAVMINASTRFNDGGALGLGAEIGISTSKLHAYGPMGLDSLTSEKWVVLGDGHTRES